MVTAAQHCDCSQCHRAAHLAMVTVAESVLCVFCLSGKRDAEPGRGADSINGFKTRFLASFPPPDQPCPSLPFRIQGQKFSPPCVA